MQQESNAPADVPAVAPPAEQTISVPFALDPLTVLMLHARKHDIELSFGQETVEDEVDGQKVIQAGARFFEIKVPCFYDSWKKNDYVIERATDAVEKLTKTKLTPIIEPLRELPADYQEQCLKIYESLRANSNDLQREFNCGIGETTLYDYSNVTKLVIRPGEVLVYDLATGHIRDIVLAIYPVPQAPVQPLTQTQVVQPAVAEPVADPST